MKCNFERLCSFLKKELDQEASCDVILHLHECEICRQTLELLSHDFGAEDQAAPFLENNDSRHRVNGLRS